MNTKSLLIEFLTEELPPLNLENAIGNTFVQNLCLEIKSFLPEEIKSSLILTPRRFGCIIENVCEIEPDTHSLRKGPAIVSGLKDLSPLPPLLGFMRSCNVNNWQDLEQNDGYFYARQTNKGRSLFEVLSNAISNALKKLPIAKNMRWGNNDYHFVRPVHNLIILHGDKLVNLTSPVLGLLPTNYTFGHRVMGEGKIFIKNSDSYFSQLEYLGKVIADFYRRRALIKQSLHEFAIRMGLVLSNSDSLLDEVTSLVEFPVVLRGMFDEKFLEVPQECLILSMAKNQKYFALISSSGKLANEFLFVANIESLEPDIVIKGNQRVLSARLADAKFFFDVDKKHGLKYYKEKLSNVVYHNRLGNQLDRIKRIEQIALNIAGEYYPQLLKEDIKNVVNLMKADLTTEMVGEFPELQGIMGKYYALHDGYKESIANAIEKHYYPRFSGDVLPDDEISIVVSLSDKLELLFGIWSIGIIPTGDKDPFALRRAALGLVRVLLKNNLDIKKLISITANEFCDLNGAFNTDTSGAVYQFILQRLFNYLTTSDEFCYSKSCVQSVCAVSPSKFYYLPSLLDTLAQFANNPNNQLLFAANKRIDNILKKNLVHINIDQCLVVNPNLFRDLSENQLFSLLNDASSDVLDVNWEDYFSQLEKFNLPIANFFDKVMVMEDNLEIRNNRLLLLEKVYKAMNVVCILSELCL